MKVGDLIADCRTGEVGLLIGVNYEDPKISNSGEPRPYLIADSTGKSHWYPQNYIEIDCEVISESR